MAAKFSHLDELSREDLVSWLRNVLLGEIPLPQTWAEQGVRDQLADAEAGMPAKTRRDLEFATIALIKELRTGPQRKIDYVENLVGLASDLKLTDAVPHLVALAKLFVQGKAKLAHAAHTAVLFAIIDLRVPQSESFWREMWNDNQRDASSAVLAAFLDRNTTDAFELLPKFGNSEELADAAVIQLDSHADLMGAPARRKFLDAAAGVADACKPHLKNAIKEWLEDIGETAHGDSTNVPVKNILLFEALGGNPVKSSSARLCCTH
ncbi:MAG: hypothetical protein ABIT37_03315 [Luteolibacter sp.]